MHFLTLVATENGYVDDKLERFDEQTEDENYLSFEDVTEYYKKEYETPFTAIRMLNGKIVDPRELRVNSEYAMKNNLVYKRAWGINKIDKRTKKAKKMKVLNDYSYKKMYKTFEEFAEKARYLTYHEKEQAYGYYYNPDAQWDWYVIGGRYADLILVKDNVTDVKENESYSRYKEEKRKAPKGYKWVSGAKKCDIEWDLMKRMEIKQAVRSYYKCKEMYETGNLGKDKAFRIEDDRLLYWGNVKYIKNETLKDFCTRKHLYRSKYSLACYSFIDEEGEWNEREEITTNEWCEKVKKFILGLDDESYITCVDCHI